MCHFSIFGSTSLIKRKTLWLRLLLLYWNYCEVEHLHVPEITVGHKSVAITGFVGHLEKDFLTAFSILG